MLRVIAWLVVITAVLTGVYYGDFVLRGFSLVDRHVSGGRTAIGVVYPVVNPDDLFRKGVELGVEVVNGNGGVLGRTLEVVELPEPEPTGDTPQLAVAQAALANARRFVMDPDIFAVIGHGSSRTAVPASVVYNEYRLLYFAPYSSNVALTGHRLDSVFALLPTDRVAAQSLVHYAVEAGIKRVVLVSDASDYGRQTVLFFAEEAQRKGIEVVFRDQFLSARKSIDDMLLLMLDNRLFTVDSIDAIVMVAYPAESGVFIREARRLNINVPILGSDTLFDPGAAAIAGSAMRDVFAVTNYFHDARDPIRDTEFYKRFSARFGVDATPRATAGYDAVLMLAEAARRTGSLGAGAMADALRLMRYYEPFYGASGKVGFTRTGEIVGQPIYVLRHDGVSFHQAARYDIDLSEEPSESFHAPHIGRQ